MEEKASIFNRHMEVLRYTDDYICKNCSSSASSNFCPHCGQETSTSRLHFKRFVFDTFQFFVFKKGLMYTVRALTVQPGVAVRQYVEGKRFHYALPFTYLLTLLALAAFLTIYFGVSVDTLVSKPNHIVNMVFKGSITKLIEGFFQKYLYISLLGVLPFIAAVAYYVYHKVGYNFTELLVSNIYMFSHVILIYTVLLPLNLVSGLLFYSAFSLLGFAYLLISYLRFFKIGVWLGIRNFFITFFVSYLLYSMILFIVLLFYFVYSNWEKII